MEQCGFGIWFYCIDWVATGGMLGGLGALFGAAAITVAADNFRKWAAREKFKYNRDVAVKILAAFYEAEFAISQIRAPFISAGELAEAEKPLSKQLENMTRDEGQKWVTRAALFNRVLAREELWDRVFQLLPLAKAVFGEEAYEALFKAIKVRQKVWAAIDVYPYTEAGNFDISQVLFRRDNPDSPEARAIETMLSEGREKLESLTKEYTAP